MNQTLILDLVLEVGTREQSVEVSASGDALQSATAELGAVVAEREVQRLPLNGRNFTQLLTLTPGAAPINVSQNASAGTFGTPTTAGAQYTFPATNGQTNRSNFFMTDGINNHGAFLSTYAVPPIIDTIQEFKVNSHSDQAEFGSSLGGIVNVVTKSGTNAIHGTAFYYGRNDAFDARNTFYDKVTPFRQNQFGFSIGGPVYAPKIYDGRNKTFFYGALQQFYYRSPANSFFRVPTAANYSGDLSDIPTPIFNPFSTREFPANSGRFIRDPFPNNQIPHELIDNDMVAYAKATLPAAGPILNGTSNAIDPTPIAQNQLEYTLRADQVIGRSDFVWFRYSAAAQNNVQSGGRPYLQSRIERPGVNYGASWVHSFNPTLSLQVQFGHSNVQDNSTTRFAGPVPDIGWSPNFAGNFTGGVTLIPGIGVDGFFSGGEGDSFNLKFGDIYQWRSAVSKITGNHTVKFGGEWASNGFDALTRNAIVWDRATQTANPSISNQPGSSLASYLLNVPDSAFRQDSIETTRYGGVMSFFIQDAWKLSPRLTVNVGLRYDRTFQPPYGREDTVGQHGGIETGSINFSDGKYYLQKVPPPCNERGYAPCMPGDGTLPANVVVDPRGKIYHDTTTNWGPRLGLAYRLGQKTALRTSFGVHYDNWASVIQTAQNYSGGWPDALGGSTNLNTPTSEHPLPTAKTQDPFLNGSAGLLPPPTPFLGGCWCTDPYARNPYSMQWNFGFQHQFAASQVMTVNYVGSGSRRLDVASLYNVALTPGPGDPQERAPFPYAAPAFYDRSIGKGNYNAFQFQFDRRYSKGLSYRAAYTWSKSIDIGSSGWYGVEGQSVTDPYHVERDRGQSGFDLTHVLSVDLVYDIPIGKGRLFALGNRILSHVLADWQFNGIFMARSGQVYNVFAGGDVANTGNAGFTQYERANLVGDPSDIPNRTWDRYINTDAFRIPDRYTFGNLGRHRLRSDPYWNLDLSVFRVIPIREGLRFELRGEAFNVTNTAIFGIPLNDMSDPANFGRITSTANHERVLQFGGRLIW